MSEDDLLAALMDSLAAGPQVYARWCWSSGSDLAHHVRDLAAAAEAEWAHEAVQGAVGPTTAEEVREALGPVDRDTAIALLADLSAGDLVFPGHTHRDRAHAERTARQVASILGPGAQWFTNTEGDWRNGRAWSPVTRFSFDGVVAGRGSGFVVVLLQVGED